MPRDPADAPCLWGPSNNIPTESAQASTETGVTAEPDPEPPSKVAVVQEETAPVRVGPGLGERLATWGRNSFTPPEIWSTDRPSLSKQLAYARKGLWGPAKGWHRKAAIAAFWGVSFPTSVAAYAIEWIGERPARWVTALVLLSLAYQIPYVPEVLGVLLRVPAWPLTATWSALGLTAT